MNELDQIRKTMVETGQPHADLESMVSVPCRPGAHRPLTALNPTIETCKTCGHATLIHDEAGCFGCDRWTTEELTRDFEVLGFAAPFVVVKRRSDGLKGSLEFTHHPRVYFGWTEA